MMKKRAVSVIFCYIMVLFPRESSGNGIPDDIMRCWQSARNFTNHADDTVHCIQHVLWDIGNIDWAKFNVTQKEKHFINSLFGKLHHRKKRQTNRVTSLQSDFRIRREYRILSDRERHDFHTAVNNIKMSGRYDMLANIHRGIVVTSAHGGPNFLGWHRIYLLLFEEALRRTNPTVSLPYWDSTIDFDIDNPTNSIIWSAPFLGNGDGYVTSGPFANWMTPVGRLTRNIGGAGSLFSKDTLRAVLTLCRTRDISDPTAQPQFNLDLLQGGIHAWVGGQMSGLHTAAYDPSFLLHHAYVDLIWELFRKRQQSFCGVDPSSDYPRSVGEHAAARSMRGFTTYRNIDGYSNFWTQFIYRYAPIPSCSTGRPICGSRFINCDISRQRCVSVTRRRSDTNFASILRARAEESTINIGPRFRSPPSERRTQSFQLRRSQFGSNLLGTSDNPSSLQSVLRARAQVGSINVGPRFAAPPSEPRTQEARFGLISSTF